MPAYDPAAAACVLAPLHLALDLAIAGNWRQSASAAVQIAADLRRAGVAANIRSHGEAAFWGAKDAGSILEGSLRPRCRRGAATRWARAIACSTARKPPARRCTSGPAARRAAAPRAICSRATPVLPLGLERSVYAVAPRLHGFRPNPLGRDVWNAWEWFTDGS